MEIVPDSLIKLFIASYLCEWDNRLRLIVKFSDIRKDLKRKIMKQKNIRRYLQEFHVIMDSKEFKMGFANYLEEKYESRIITS